MKRALVRLRERPASQLTMKLHRARGSATTVAMSRRELNVLFDRLARQHMDMSGKEFLRRLDAGTLPDSPMADYLATIAGTPRAS